MSEILVGYARCSTDGQDLTVQRDALAALGVQPERIYVDHGLTGTNRTRPGLREALAACRDNGRVLVVTRLDRLGRSVLLLVQLGAELRERDIGLRVLEQGIDTSTAEGRAMFGMLSVLAELQRELITTNTRDGLAGARGRRGGRPASLSPAQVTHARQLYDAGQHTVAEIAAPLGVARTTVYGHLQRR